MIRSWLDLAPVRAFLNRQLVVSVPQAGKRVALTFDDGPSPAHTPALLELLAERGARATFFLIGKRARAHPELARRIVSEGHEVGNHGWSHIPLPLLSPEAMTREVAAGGHAVTEAAGTVPRCFRPPNGWITPRSLAVVRRLGYTPVLGDVYPRDVSRPGTEVLVRHVLRRVGPGSIVILHDGGGWRASGDRRQSVAAAARIADALAGEGYTLVTVSALIDAGSAA